jgi:uncharacterized membrane protein YeiB
MVKISSSKSEDLNPSNLSTDHRIPGYDIARALALFGMLVINFWAMTDTGSLSPKWMDRILGHVQGRAAATFVLLAGVGIALLSKRALLKKDLIKLGNHRLALVKRAFFLFVLGLINSLIWPSDILHFYAIYLLIGALFLPVSGRRLLFLAFIPVAAFAVLMSQVDFDREGQLEFLSSIPLWDVTGMLRHLFFNGIYPVFPWAAFLFVGMWLGRQNLSDGRVRKKLFLIGIGAMLFAESISWVAFNGLLHNPFGIDLENARLWLAVDPWEPMPLFAVSAGGSALLVIVGCIHVSEKNRRSRWILPLAALGRSTLTLYMAHIVAGDLALRLLRPADTLKIFFPLWGALLFYSISIPLCTLWNRHFPKGPFELLAHRFVRAFPHAPPLLRQDLKSPV